MNRHLSILLGSASALALTAAPPAAQEIFDLGEIVLTATAEPLEKQRTGASVEVLTEEDLSTSKGILLTDELNRMPGVSSVQSGPAGNASDLKIRGAQERFTAVYIDGIKVNDPSATGGQYGNFGALPNGALSRVEVLKGSQSALYGAAAVAGVVNIFTLNLEDAEEGTIQRIGALGGSYQTYSANYAVTQKSGPLTLALAMTGFDTNGFSAADEDDGNTEEDGARETRLSFGAAYDVNESVTLGFNAFVEDGRADFDEFGPQDGTPGDENSDRNAKGVRAFAHVQLGGWSHNAQLTYYKVKRSLSSEGAFFSFDSDFRADRRRFDYVASGEITDTIALSLGGDAQKETADYDNLAAGSEDTHSKGAFAEAIFSPSSDLDVISALRIDDHSEFGSKTTGRLAFSYRPAEGLTLRGSAATGYRPPSIDELFGNYPDPDYPFFGNPDLTPETSTSYELGFDYNLMNGTSLSFTAFRNEIKDLIQYESCPIDFGNPFFPCQGGTFSSLVNVPGKSVYKGFEIGGAFDLSERLRLVSAYTYIDAKAEDGSRLIRVPRHDLNLALDASLTDRLSATVNMRHVADRAAEGFPEETPDDYTTFDVTFFYDVTSEAEVFVRLENITNKAYQTVPGYGTSDRAIYVGLRATF